MTELASGEGSPRETIAGLNAVALLGSFMHAVSDAEKVAELAAGGLAALARVPLGAVAWYGAEGPLRMTGTFDGARILPPAVAGALDELCRTLPRQRPSSLDVVPPSHPLRRAGVTEVLALPLRVSNDCLGFLLAGGPQGSVPSDLTLVQVLGAQTSTALYVARLQAAEAARAAQTAALAERLRGQGEQLARALRLQEELIDLVLLGRDAGAILAHLGRELGAPVWLLDEDCRIVAACDGPDDDGAVPGPAALRRALRPVAAGRGPQAVHIPAADGRRRAFLVQRVSTDRQTFGHLLVGSAALGPVDTSVLQGGRLVLALRLLVERSVAEAEDRAGRELLADALANRGGARTAAALAARLGYRDGPGPAVVLVVRAGTGPARRTALEELRGADRTLAGMAADDVVCLVRPDAADLTVRQLLDHVGPGSHVGLSDPSAGGADLGRAHREATAAAVLAARRGVPVLRFADLGLHRIMFDVGNADRIDDHVEHWIGPLLRYDEAHGTRLLETLSQHLRGENQSECARVLSIHPSTLKYRLNRIRELLDHDLTRPDVRFNVDLALRLRDCAGPP